MTELRFNVFGRLIAIVGKPGEWAALVLGLENALACLANQAGKPPSPHFL